MTAQAKALEAPTLKEASENVLDLSKLKDFAHGQVDGLPNVTPGDMISLQVNTSTGNSWTEKKLVTAVPAVLEFLIPKKTFAENFAQGAKAKLYYTLTRAGQNSEVSPTLEVALKQQVEELPAPVLKEALVHDGKLKLFIHNLVDPAHGEVFPVAGTVAGDSITLQVNTTTGNAWDSTYILTEADEGMPIVFAIPKEIFASNLAPKAIARLYYLVKKADQTIGYSAPVDVELEQ